MKREYAKVGTRVACNIDFANVPKGTKGVIDDDYETGVMVAWDLPDSPLPPKHVECLATFGVSMARNMTQANGGKWPLRDGFSYDELRFLDLSA